MINRILEAKNNRQNQPQTNDETHSFIQQATAGNNKASRFGALFPQPVIHSIKQLILQLSKRVFNTADFSTANNRHDPIDQQPESPLFFLTGLSVKTRDKFGSVIAGDIISATLVTISGDTDLEFMLSKNNIETINSELYQSKEPKTTHEIIESLIEQKLHQIQLSGQDVLNYVCQTTEFIL